MCPVIAINAQGVCSSSALAPVFSQTFGTSAASTTKSKVPAGFTTNYTFNGNPTASNQLKDGQYMVTPLVQNSLKTDWAVGGDHTGDVNGNMFLVNAGTGASLFFTQLVTNLCPGSIYSFSAWMANVNTVSNTKSICGSGLVYPKVTFNIKSTGGALLGTFTTDTLPLTVNRTVAPNWQKYGFQFALPSGTTSLILEMVDFYGGQPQCGNDLAIDDIVFSACTPDATATLSTASSICSGTATSIHSSIVNSPYSNPAYQWQKSMDAGTTWTNVGSAGTTAANYTISNATVADSGMYRVVVGPDIASLSSATCVTASNAVSLWVNPIPLLSLTYQNTLCAPANLSITSVVSSGTPAYSYSWSGPNGFTATSANVSIPNISPTQAGQYTLTVTDTKNCSAVKSASIAIYQTPVVLPVTGSAGACAGTGLQLSDLTPGGVWSTDNSAVATVDQSGTVSLLSGGSAIISYTLNNQGCTASSSKTITVASVVMHPDVIECNNGITHFSATDTYYAVSYSNSNPGNTYSWQISGGQFSYQGSSTATSQYPNVQLQTGYSYQAVVLFTTNGVSCSDTQMIYKNVTAADTILNAHDTTVCYHSGPIYLSGAVSPVTNVVTWTSSGTGIFSTPNTLTTTYTPSIADKAAGLVKLYLSGSSSLNATGNCGNSVSKDSMVLRIYPDNTGSNMVQSICSNTALNFIPQSAIPGSSFSWSSAIVSGSLTGNSPAGTGTISDSLVNTSANADAVVAYTITPFAFTPTNNSCQGTPFTLTVTLKPRPVLSINNLVPGLCTGTKTNIQFSSSIAGSLYTWTSGILSGAASGNSSSLSAAATNTITDSLVNGFSSNTTVRYQITATSPSGCTRTVATDVLIQALPSVAVAGADQQVCNIGSVVLSANTPATGIGNWSFLSGPGSVSFANSSSPFSAVTGLIPGTYQLVWSTANGSCANSKDTVRIINSPQTVGGTVSGSAVVCEGVNAGQVILTGYTGSIIGWESSADGGLSWLAIANTSAQLSYSNLSATTLYRAILQSGNCSSVVSNPATITVNPLTVPGILSANAVVCAASNSGTLSLSGYTGAILRWESSTDGGNSWPITIGNTTNSYQYTNLNNTSLFRVVLQNGICGAANSNPVTITVTPQTIPGLLSADNTVCATANSGTLVLAGYTGSILNWESSADNGNTWNHIATTGNSYTYTNLNSSTIFRALVQNGVCNSLYSNTVTITVLPAVTNANAGPDQTLCNITSIGLAANSPVSGTGTWSVLPGAPSVVSIVNPSSPTSTVNGLVVGTYRFVWTIANG
ncbi:MAG: hypothetical protein RLZZ28_497, partial [Bacteroidota bacterium]